jgi:hypothetical protein
VSYKTILVFITFLILSLRSDADVPWISDSGNIGTGGNHIIYEMNKNGYISAGYVCPYQLNELSIRTLEIMLPVSGTDIAGALGQCGDEVFNETLVLIEAGKLLSEKIYLSVECGLYSVNSVISEGGSTVLTNLKMLYKPAENLIIGTYVFNPIGLEIKRQSANIKTGQSFHTGFRFDPVESFSFILEYSRFIGKYSTLSLGADYAILRTFHLKGGVSLNPVIPSWGIGWNTNKLALSFAISRHPVLGVTPAVSINYNLKSK